MIQSYFKIAWRSLWRSKVFSFINIFGLAVSMSVCLLIISILKDQYSFDTFHDDPDRIYRVNTTAFRTEGGNEQYASSPPALGDLLHESLPAAENVTRLLFGLSGNTAYQNTSVPIQGLFADPAFFEVFGFKLAQGNTATALRDPYSVVLTQASAARIFGKENPMGKVVEIEDKGAFTVTGVLAKFPQKTHLEFEILGSYATYAALETAGQARKVSENWADYYSGYTYLKLKPEASPSEIETTIRKIAAPHYLDTEMESRTKSLAFFLQPLPSITPGERYSNNMGKGAPSSMLDFFTYLALAIMLLALFNYTNLTLSKSLDRAREIGVRKVSGARRSQLIFQFISESVLTALVALAIAYLMYLYLTPAFQSLSFFNEFDFSFEQDATLATLFLGFALTVGVIAGAFPALYLSAFKPVRVLKKMGGISTTKIARFNFQKGLVVFQLALSFVFILVITAFHQNVQYALNYDYGFRQENIINLSLQGNDYGQVATLLSQHPEVEQLSGISHPIGTWADGTDDVRKKAEDTPITIKQYFINEHYLQNMDIEMLIGQPFTEELSAQYEQFVLVNEKTLEVLNVGTPTEALGKTLIFGDSTELIVRGILKDFQFKPLAYDNTPVAFRYSPENIRMVNIRVAGNNLPDFIEHLESSWAMVDEVNPVAWKFKEEEVRETYSMFLDVRSLVSFITGLAILIAVLGLLGMASFVAKAKVKEVGIRKVLGATAWGLTAKLSIMFIVLMLIAVVLAAPLAYFINSMFLENVPYKPDFNLWLIAASTLLLIIPGAIAIFSNIWKTASLNPALTLRDE